MHNSSDQSHPESDKTSFYKLPYIGNYSEQIQKKPSEVSQQFFKYPDLKIVFTSFEITNGFSTKDKIPYFLNSL